MLIRRKRKKKASIFIQWKGTDVCMDFHCVCGSHLHFDGDFAYVVKCPVCTRLFRMPTDVHPKELKPGATEYNEELNYAKEMNF